MDRATVERYDARGEEWARAREPVRRDAARAFGRRVRDGGMRLDAGAGAGRYTAELGEPVIALDASATMLRLLGDAAPTALPVRGDLEALPFRSAGLEGAWANMSYLHVPRARLPLALADLHRALRVGSAFDIQVLHGDYEGSDLEHDDVGGRFFSAVDATRFLDLLVGAGLEVETSEVDPVETHVVRASGRRSRTLADTVAPGLRLLVCGLNPSLYAADRGVGYARPGNRFWPAMLAAGLATVDRDPLHALRHHGIGMTDLCKRATTSSAELTKDEYRDGASRVDRLVRWLEPHAICFVGLEGWRAAVDPQATAGPQPAGFAGVPAYVMPSTSGLNAHARLDDLVDHLRTAAALAGL